MCKIILSIFALFTLNVEANYPPTSLRGQSQSTATTTFNFQVPNNQATKTATGTLVETGSQNLLSNPGFEHSTVGTDWNVTSGTLTASGSAPFGSFSGTFSGSVANGNIQSLTGSGTAQAGLNCLVSAFVKTASSNVQLCAIHNGTLNTNLCVNVNSNNTWAQYQIPTVCDAVSTVARIRITTSVSTTFDTDNVFVGVNPNFGSVAQAQFVGSLKFIGATGCSWATLASTFTTLAANANCNTPTVTGNILTNGGAKAPQFTMSGQAGTYRIVVHGGIVNYAGSATGLVASRWTDGTNVSSIATSFNSSTGFPITEYTITQSSSFSNATFSMQARGNGSTQFFFEATSPDFSDAIISVYYFPPASSIVTTNNQDYDWTAYTPTIGAGVGTPTSIAVFHKRVGSNLHVKGSFTTGTVAGSLVTISLPSGLSLDTSKLSISTNTSTQPGAKAGEIYANGSSGANAPIVTCPGTSTTSVYMASRVGTITMLVPENGSNIFNNLTPVSFDFIVPIQGWNNNNVIVGTFANIPTVSGVASPKLCSANVSNNGTATLNTQFGNCVSSVTRTSAGYVTVNFNSSFWTVAPQCQCQAASDNGEVFRVHTESTTSAICSNSGVSSDRNFKIFCIGY